MIQILKFGEGEINSMFYACGLYVLCVVPMSVVHPIVGSIILVEAITIVK
jgi:hypothetical protein